MMGKIKYLLVLAFSFLLISAAVPSSVMAFDPFGDVCRGNGSATVCQDAGGSGNPIFGPGGIISVVVNLLALVIGVAAVIVMIIAGIQYMVSTGDPTKVNNAKNAIIYAVIGLVIAVVARVIVVFVLNKL